ncbi:uncharacterized protein LOC134262442 [Saccostrea cucullata]|uniref:uncharacterized protein LOC134262442 n=1 Tax=Saccostrea cuccullata TaxID=36930 RepID=UPI002ED198C4
MELKKILDSNDIPMISTYESRNDEFRSLPPKVNVSLPSLSLHQINTEQLYQMFGSLSELSITKGEHCYTMDATQEDEVCPSVKELLDKQELIITIDTGYKELFNVICLNDEEIWTSGKDKIMKLYNLQGNLLKSIQTKSGNDPCNIAVTRSGYLIYTDFKTKSIFKVRNHQIVEEIRLQNWIPCSVCTSCTGDVIVIMDSEDKQSKVVRYSDFTEKQTIQLDDKNEPLFLSGTPKYITENKNMDICVADSGAYAVVVVNKVGKLRFRYTACNQASNTRKYFYPRGIITDSQNHILIADSFNDNIHIQNQDGQFLRFIKNCDLVFIGFMCRCQRKPLCG